jgi:DNA ligase-1
MYDVVDGAGFKAGEPVPYLSLVRAFIAIESTTLRLAKTEHLANLLRSVVLLTPVDLLPVLYLIAGKVGPDFAGVELGVGESLLIKAIADASGGTLASVKAALRVAGDLGKVAVASKKQTRTIFPPPPLTVRSVFAGLRDIAKSAGSQSRNRKQDLILRMLVSCRESEAQYIIRMLQGKFRIGCSEKTVLSALARALV